MKTILITGGYGFIGSNFIRYALTNHRDWRILNMDAMTYAANPESVADLANHDRYEFIHANICSREDVRQCFAEHKPDGVIHFAAESHVDRSIVDAGEFVDTNVKGTLVLLESAKQFGVERFVHISTDEIYGELGLAGKFKETDVPKPNNPYSASKMAGEFFVQSYCHTYKLPAVIVRPSNNYGAFQHPEKLIPILILKALNDKPIPIHGDGSNIRDWLHVGDNCRAIDMLYERGRAGEIYNIGGDCEKQNVEVAKAVLDILGKPHSLIEYVTGRQGNDRRYALDIRKISGEIGWEPRVDFMHGLEDTIRWYKNNPEWLNVFNLKGYDTFL